MKQFSNRKSQSGFTRYHTAPGFTLIELLIVIAILGLLAAGVFTALNVTSILNKGNLAKAKTFSASVENDLSINQVGKWSFEDGTGATTFKDTSGYNNNGSCSGGSCPTWKNATECALGLGGCLSFDGVDDGVNAGNNSSLQITGDLTISAWIKPATLPGSGNYAVFVAKDRDTGDRGYSFEIENNKIFGLLSQNAAGTIETRATGNTTLKTNIWYHVALVYRTSTSLALYLNGVQDKTVASSVVSSINNSADSLGIGRRITGIPRLFNGQIDEVSIYNQALLSSQIQQLYAKGLSKHQLVRQVIK